MIGPLVLIEHRSKYLQIDQTALQLTIKVSMISYITADLHNLQKLLCLICSTHTTWARAFFLHTVHWLKLEAKTINDVTFLTLWKLTFSHLIIFHYLLVTHISLYFVMVIEYRGTIRLTLILRSATSCCAVFQCPPLSSF